jgi:hypothetical protein
MKNTLLPTALLVLVLFGLVPSHAHPQCTTPIASLFKTVQSLDSQFFDAYHHCDLPTISSMVADDLEFYHDISGMALGRQSLVDGVKNNICGKVTRELIPGTLEVYPIATMARWRLVSIVSTTRGTRMLRTSGKPSSSRSGKTKMEFGRSPAPSALITTPLQNRPAICAMETLAELTRPTWLALTKAEVQAERMS